MNINYTIIKLQNFLRKNSIKIPFILTYLLEGRVRANTFILYDVISTLSFVQQLLMQIGPILSAVLFVIAGIFYAVGQLLPPDKKANFHTTAINIIIGAIVVAILSVASNSLAIAASHLVSNLTINSTK